MGILAADDRRAGRTAYGGVDEVVCQVDTPGSQVLERGGHCLHGSELYVLIVTFHRDKRKNG